MKKAKLENLCVKKSESSESSLYNEFWISLIGRQGKKLWRFLENEGSRIVDE